MMRIFKFILTPWFFVLTGVAMTVFSALITNYYIAENTKVIESLQSKLSQAQRSIDMHWENNKSMERKEDIGMIVLLLGDIGKVSKDQAQVTRARIAITRYLEGLSRTGALTRQEFKALIDETANASKLDTIFAAMDRYRFEAINTVNDLYLEQRGLEQNKMQLQKRNQMLANIALFLQIMGLILVLSNGLLRGGAPGEVL